MNIDEKAGKISLKAFEDIARCMNPDIDKPHNKLTPREMITGDFMSTDIYELYSFHKGKFLELESIGEALINEGKIKSYRISNLTTNLRFMSKETEIIFNSFKSQQFNPKG